MYNLGEAYQHGQSSLFPHNDVIWFYSLHNESDIMVIMLLHLIRLLASLVKFQYCINYSTPPCPTFCSYTCPNLPTYITCHFHYQTAVVISIYLLHLQTQIGENSLSPRCLNDCLFIGNVCSCSNSESLTVKSTDADTFFLSYNVCHTIHYF